MQVLATQYAQTCALMAAYGTTYPDGSGLHDIHLNAGEVPGGPPPGPDRAGRRPRLLLHAPRIAHWVFIRFATQHLPA